MSLFLLAALACTPPPPPVVSVPAAVPPSVVLDAPAWPEEGAPLRHPVIEVPAGFVPQKVFVIAGHGSGRDNIGNLGAWCTREQDFTLRTADGLADLLDATGQFEAIRARTGDQRPTYDARLAHLHGSGATAMIELHSDARADGMVPHRRAADGEICYRDDGDPGFTVLVRDRGAGTPRRLRLARAIARAMADAGFTPWVGDNYQGLYEADEVPGVWRDRRGLKMLRRARVPAVIIETHNGKDGRETLRWEEPATHHAFGRAIIAALLDFYGQAGGLPHRVR